MTIGFEKVIPNQALQLTLKAPFVLCITLRFIFAQNKGHFLIS